ncbi:MAG: hypothetical protein V1904_15585 [Bacteroidota bacterium]
MKTKLFTVLVLILFSVHTAAQQKNRYFKADSATLMQWHGGASDAPSGTSYTFYLAFKKDCMIKFDSVWIGTEKSLPVFMITTSGYKGIDSIFKKDSTYILYVQIYNPGSFIYFEKKDEQENSSPTPVKYDGAALIRFYVNGKKHYCSVGSFHTLPSPQYP